MDADGNPGRFTTWPMIEAVPGPGPRSPVNRLRRRRRTLARLRPRGRGPGGPTAVLAASASFHFGRLRIGEVKDALRARGEVTVQNPSGGSSEARAEVGHQPGHRGVVAVQVDPGGPLAGRR